MGENQENHDECKMSQTDAQGNPNLCCCYILNQDDRFEDACYLPADECCLETSCDMSIDYPKKAKQCCHRENNRLIEQLDICDSKSKTSADRNPCCRTAARRAGRRSRKGIIGAYNPGQHLWKKLRLQALSRPVLPTLATIWE